MTDLKFVPVLLQMAQADSGFDYSETLAGLPSDVVVRGEAAAAAVYEKGGWKAIVRVYSAPVEGVSPEDPSVQFLGWETQEETDLAAFLDRIFE